MNEAEKYYNIKEGVLVRVKHSAIDTPTLIIPNSVIKILSRAIEDVSRMESIAIPASVEEIEEGAICHSPRLKTIAVDEKNKRYKSIDNCLVDTKTKTALVSCNGNIPSGVERIGELAFTCGQIEEIKIPAFVTSISDKTFETCGKQYKISVDKDNPVYHSAYNCLIETAKKRLMVFSNNSIIPCDGSVTSIAKGAFKREHIFAEIFIPWTITELSDDLWQEYPINYPTEAKTHLTPKKIHFNGCVEYYLRVSSKCNYPREVTLVEEYNAYRCGYVTRQYQGLPSIKVSYYDFDAENHTINMRTGYNQDDKFYSDGQCVIRASDNLIVATTCKDKEQLISTVYKKN